MKTRNAIATAFLILPLLASAQPPMQPPAVVELIEDDTDGFTKQLNNDGVADTAQVGQELRDVYSGVSCLRVTPFQRYSSKIQGWNYAVVEKPLAGQYRYLRFAWKRVDGPGIMIQLHGNGSWNQRYLAGKRSDQTAAWGPVISLSEKTPSEWTVVTRDLFKDFGPLTIQGFALTPMDGGGAGLFDHVYLGRSIEDLDRQTAEVFGKAALKEALTLLELGNLWEDLADIKTAGPAVRKLVAGRKESVPYLDRMLRVKRPEADTKEIARLVRELDDDEFAVREAAFRALDKLGDAAIRPLRKAQAQTASVEVRRAIAELLKNRGAEEETPTNEQLRVIRAARVLEWSGTAQALAVLDALVKQPPDALVWAEIRQARERLAKDIAR